jgi:hypothetical protein
MLIGAIQGATRQMGKDDGFACLRVLDTRTKDGSPLMVTAWHPTDVELAALNAGAPIYVMILGTEHPPMQVKVGKMPTES